MATFTNETRVREKLQLADTETVSSTLVLRSIDDAHEKILPILDSTVDPQSPEEALIMAETLLAGAELMRSLAAKGAHDLRNLRIGGQQIDEEQRFRALMVMSRELEKDGWRLLEPYVKPRPSRSIAKVTNTIPVLGETPENQNGAE